MKKKLIVEIMVCLMVALFLYAAFSKYAFMFGFIHAMHNQPFPHWLADVLIWTLPPAEIVVAIMMTIEKLRLVGLVSFVGLMTIFTLYIGAILTGFFPNVPCTCGELFQSLTWGEHLLFNVFFIVLGVAAISLNHQNLTYTKFGDQMSTNG